MSEEAKVILDGKELEVKDFSDQQKISVQSDS
jgi:hypothetical protein